MGKHSFDFVALLFGVAFAAMGLAIATGALRLEDDGFDSAIPLGIGFVGLTLAAITLNRFFRHPGGFSREPEPALENDLGLEVPDRSDEDSDIPGSV